MEQVTSISIYSPTPLPQQTETADNFKDSLLMARNWAKKNELTGQLDILPHPQVYWGPVFFNQPFGMSYSRIFSEL